MLNTLMSICIAILLLVCSLLNIQTTLSNLDWFMIGCAIINGIALGIHTGTILTKL